MFHHFGEDTGAVKVDNIWTFLIAILIVIGLLALFGISPYELGSGLRDFFEGVFGK